LTRLAPLSILDLMTWERTFVLIKPDGVKRGLIGQVFHRYERAGLVIVGSKLVSPSRKKAEKHYEEHRGKSFFAPLVDLLLSGPSMAIALEGAHAIEVVRKLNGDTEPRTAAPGTIRGDFAHMGYTRSPELKGVINNIVHASDSPESALRELSLWFDNDFADPYTTNLDGMI
jgi:nucleoside-diphosphate kinase